MTSPSNEPADVNLARLIRRWSDPLDDERTSRARAAFFERATSPRSSTSESPAHRRWGFLATAAGLLMCAGVFGSLFLVDPLGRRVPAQNDPRVQALIDDLAHADVAKRDRAAADLAAMGAKARPLLEEAVKGSSAEIRVRARDVLDRVAAGVKDARATMEAELEKQSVRAVALAAENAAKAVHIADLRQQLDAANALVVKMEADQAVFVRQLEVQLVEIAELQKKLEDAKKK
jgi:hypothetical protein